MKTKEHDMINLVLQVLIHKLVEVKEALVVLVDLEDLMEKVLI